jgi:RND family efflux transporter MFP subunit
MTIRMNLRFQVIGLLLLGPALTGCGESGSKQGVGVPPAMVIVAKPVQRTVVDLDEYPGRFVPGGMVEIRARVTGYLDAVHFRDGQVVKQGELLFTIDKRPFQNVLDQARANLESAYSTFNFAKGELARSQQLLRDKKLSEQTYGQNAMAYGNAQAAVLGHQAMVRQAELDLELTELRSPITGRIGDRRLTPGNLVTGGSGGNTTLLATIVSLDPIAFEFAFDEAAYLRYERAAESDKESTGSHASVPAKLKLIDEQEPTHLGQMDFIDNVIDPSSHMIRVRALFSNPRGLFTPGMNGLISIPAAPPYKALLVDNAAVSTEQAREYVLVVDPDNVARQRYVILGVLIGNHRVIKHGLALEDRVILGGSIFARPGAKVALEEVPKEAPAPQLNLSPSKRD